jgi:hypothetical protein
MTDPEKGVRILPRNSGKYLPTYRAPHAKNLEFLSTKL